MRRPLSLAVLVIALALVASGCIGFRVTKQTTGDNPPSGDFVVHIECDNDDPPQDQDLTFPGADAFPQTQESDLYEFELGAGTCTITETNGANALATTIECVEATLPDEVTCTPLPGGGVTVDVDFAGVPGFAVVEVLVTNDLGDPPAAAAVDPVEVQPLFTG